MDKRGQATIFFVLGLVIFTIFIIIYAVESGMIKNLHIEDDADIVRDYVYDCFSEITENSLFIIGLQGGRIEPRIYYDLDGIKVSYWHYEGKSLIADEKEVESEVEKYVASYLPGCVDSIKNIYIENGSLSLIADLRKNSIKIDAIYPIIVLKNNMKIGVEERYSIEHNIRLGDMRDSASKIVADSSKDAGSINVESLYEIGKKYYVNIVNKGDTQIFILNDYEYDLNGKNYTFIFAEKFKNKGGNETN